jgi:peptidyl-prolyl cis-trans isomerase C
MTARGTLGRLLREPLAHFAALGLVLFALYHLVRPTAGARGEASRIEVGQAELDRLEGAWKRSWKRAPSRDELAELVRDYVDEEVLFREASALHLERDDPAVRRRLIEKLAVMKHPQAPQPEPSTDELRRWFAERRHRFHQPGRFWFAQVFFDPNRRRGALNDDAAAALALLLRASPEPPEAAGDPSPVPAHAEAMTDLQVAHLYGPGFLGSLAGIAVGRWQGPLSSTHGVHVVRIERREEARDPTFEEAMPAVRADWITSKSKGYADAAAELLPRYRIELGPAVKARLAGAAQLAPLLRERR